jgi:DNA-binding NtrC family response regulator
MKPILLVAEGDPELREIYRRFFAVCSYDVQTAADVLECLEKLRRRVPAVLVLDQALHWGGGDGFLAWLREQSAASEVPVVLTGTSGYPLGVAEDIEPPVVKFLLKPFALTALLEIVGEAVATKERRQPSKSSPDRAAPCSELFIR